MRVRTSTKIPRLTLSRPSVPRLGRGQIVADRIEDGYLRTEVVIRIDADVGGDVQLRIGRSLGILN
jgi:hypothetical protein